jgi:hypothetical protein
MRQREIHIREKRTFIHRSGRGGNRESIHSQAQVEDETEGNHTKERKAFIHKLR